MTGSRVNQTRAAIERVAVLWAIFFTEAMIIGLIVGWQTTDDFIIMVFAVFFGMPIALVLALFLRRKNPIIAIVLGTIFITAAAIIAGDNAILLTLLVPPIGPVLWLILPNEPRNYGPSACLNCGYSTQGLDCDMCPECGNAIATPSGKPGN